MSIKPTPRCPTCQRTELYFAGCSQVDCPQRKIMTAALPGYGWPTPGVRVGIPGDGRVEPTCKE